MEKEKLNTRGKLVWGATIEDNPEIGWLYRNQKVLILDCIEIDEETEQYRYLCELDYHGEKYRAWIDCQYVDLD
jgi:hypothetical protein